MAMASNKNKRKSKIDRDVLFPVIFLGLCALILLWMILHALLYNVVSDYRLDKMLKEQRETWRIEKLKRNTNRFDHHEEVVIAWREHLDSLEYQRHIDDSLKQAQAALDEAERQARIKEYMKNYKPRKYGSSSAGSEYAGDGHPGTKPDDPLFGFDPWDDEDDAYNLERNIIDPYPGEW